MDKTQDIVLRSQAAPELSLSTSAPSSSTASQSFVFTSSRYASSSTHRQSELSRGLRNAHAQGAVDVKSTLPFPHGYSGFVPLPSTSRFSASTNCTPAESSSRSPVDYFSERQPSAHSSPSTSSAYNWLATPSESDSVASTPSTCSSAASYPVPTAPYYPREIDLSLVELFAVARKLRKEKQRSRANTSSSSSAQIAPHEANSTSDDTPHGQRRLSLSQGNDSSSECFAPCTM